MSEEQSSHKTIIKKYGCGSGGGAFYGLGLIGAAVYYISHAAGFWDVILAILKALVWPAFFVYDVLKFLHG